MTKETRLLIMLLLILQSLMRLKNHVTLLMENIVDFLATARRTNQAVWKSKDNKNYPHKQI